MTVWRESFRVRASEMGPDARLRLPALFDLFQEAAGNNAAALGWGSDVLLARGQTWILSRLTLKLLALPAWREDITVETWPAGVHRLWALREFRVARADGTPLAQATSGWILLDVAKKRPLRQSPEVSEVAKTSPPRLIEDSFEPLAAPDETGRAAAAPFRVTRYDLDLNAHANNVTILRALLTALPVAAAPPLTFEADFRGEAFEGDVLAARVQETPRETRMLLFKESDGKEVARAVIRPSG
ncbi:MAG: thioesterase [Acidobacteriota bacterium]|nr:thioesterase [Acidobacteriota bacterium]